jgi:hypothetical protein
MDISKNLIEPSLQTAENNISNPKDNIINMGSEKVILVTFSDDRSGRKMGLYGATQDKIYNFLKNRNPSFGITDFLFMKFHDIIGTDFYNKNRKMLDIQEPDMNGRCYKPYAILEGLKKINYGDFLIYNDSSPELWKSIDTNEHIDSKKYNINVIKQLCKANDGILTASVNVCMGNPVENYHRHEFYTLDRCMKIMNLEEYKYSLQHASGMIVLQKTEKSVNFIEEWLKFNLIDEAASLGYIKDDTIDKIDRNFWTEEYINKSGHRHDQSISGLLINKMNNYLVIPPNNFYPQYNFLTFCLLNYNYEFVYSNLPKTVNIIKTVYNTTKNSWEVQIFKRV